MFCELNATKIKDLAIDFRKETSAPKAINIGGQSIEQVDENKYLCTIVYNKLNF